MPHRVVRNVTVGALLAVCSAAMAVDQAHPAATNELLQAYPGARVAMNQGRIQMFYGAPMTSGSNAAEAAEAFVQLHGAAFGMGNIQFVPDWAADTGDLRHSIYSFRETIDGYPVELGDIRVMVLNGATPRVVFAGGNLAPRPEGGFPVPIVTSELAQAIAKSLKEGAKLDVWHGPATLVVYQGNGDWIKPVLTWKITGDSSNIADRAARTFFINASTGALVAIRSEVSHTDVGGTVKINATGGLDPDIATNPPVLMDTPEIKVGITGGNTAFTSRLGVFSIVNPGTAAVTLNTGVGTASGFGGQWVQVVPTGVAALTATQAGVTPPGPGALVLNPAPAAGLTAQANAFVYTNTIHNYFKDRAPSFTGLDQVLRANTGVAGSCNAFFSAGSGGTPCTTCNINFYNAGGGCNNTAYANVIMHEYGHFIVNRLNRSQNAFGEGYGDTCAMLIQDDTIIGRNFQTNGGVVRTPMTANIQYPCSASCGGEIHCCGQLLASIWYQIRLNLTPTLGSGPALDKARQLQVSWSLITAGGPAASTSAGPGTLNEVLTVDDNDGNLSNGTPNYAAICAAFNAHSIVASPAVNCAPVVTCYPNCDGNTTSPILNALDFTCFLNKFAAGDTYANCDASTTVPVLNALDFTCFLNKYAAGCT